MHRRKVVLPEPEGPRRQTTSPGWTSMSMPLRTSLPWNALVTLTAWTRGSPVRVPALVSLLVLISDLP